MTAIALASLLPAGFDPTEFKVHFAVYNQVEYPIHVLANAPDEWKGWNEYRSNKDDFNRRFIFSLAQDRHDPTLWLFGGVWEVTGRRPEVKARSYDIIARDDILGPFVRRLWVRAKLTSRTIRRSMETVLNDMSVASILEEAFVGDPFPGHDRINHSLAEIQTLVSQQRPDWRIALEHMKGVYVIHDQESGEPYVGSAYEDTGIWQRWSYYAATLHGDNVGLQKHLEAKGEDHFRQNMKFALLEFWSMRTDDSLVLERETYWKNVLLSRALGHNKN